MRKELRPYQQSAIQEAFSELSKSDDPILMVMSVGGGKSITAGMIVKRFELLKKRVLCLVNSAELVRNNSLAFKEIGGAPSIFCSSLNEKDISNPIIFATPQSVISAIKSNHHISNLIFNLIVVDEAHGISYKNESSVFMRILRHYKQLYPKMRLLGLTGTPYRLDNNSSESIVGDKCLFKKSIANITTSWLVKNNFLVAPVFGYKSVQDMDMSELKPDSKGYFKQENLQKVVESNKRLTGEILDEVQKIMTNRNGAFIFCSTIPHCFEAFNALPKDLSRIIIGSTPDKERHEILSKARNKEIKYLISVSCLLVGVDVPYFDTTIFLRPTQSLTLFVQAIGRCLRLHPEKKEGLVLDYAKNLETFSDIDDPFINEAIQPKEIEKDDYCIPCNACTVLNLPLVRRCRGIHDNKRCDYYFEWKDCPSCSVQNDKSARICRSCNEELIDPNAKLTSKAATKSKDIFTVVQAKYWIADNGHPVFHAMYTTPHGMKIYESFVIRDSRTKNIFYGQYVRNALDKPSQYYPQLHSIAALKRMLNFIRTPSKLECSYDVNRYKVHKRIYYEDIFTS